MCAGGGGCLQFQDYEFRQLQQSVVSTQGRQMSCILIRITFLAPMRAIDLTLEHPYIRPLNLHRNTGVGGYTVYTRAISTSLYIYVSKGAWSVESASANGVAVEGAGRSSRLGAEVEQREPRQSSRKADRERAEATALFWRGGLL